MKHQTKAHTKEGFRPSRTVTLCILIAVQAALFISYYLYLSTTYLIILTVLDVLNFLLILRVIVSDSNPAYKISWMFGLFLLKPFFAVCYLLWGEMASARKLQRRLTAIGIRARDAMKQHARPCSSEYDRVKLDLQYLSNITGYAPFDNTAVTYLSPGEAKLEALIDELNCATEYIFMEYFIIHEGYMWDTIFEVLCRKVKEGVDVRILVDDMGSSDTLPRKARKKIRQAGIHIVAFNRFRPVIDFFMNYRDHRKIVVIDGHTAFTGGINLADEYINRIEVHGHWKDASVMLKGNGVYNLTVMFLQMWEYASGESVDFSEYAPVDTELSGGVVFPFCDGPDNPENPAEGLYTRIINNARRYVYIQTPYLVIDNEMVMALIGAAQAGIDVRIVTPHIHDKWYVHLLTRSHYKRLIRHGVKIYEYTPGFIHSKVFLSDDLCGVVGTINMDFRSLYMHFECGVYIADHPVLEEMKADFFDRVLKKSHEMTLQECRCRNPFQWAATIILKLLAPLM